VPGDEPARARHPTSAPRRRSFPDDSEQGIFVDVHAACVSALLVLASCGRYGFDEVTSTSELRFVAGVTSLDVEQCSSRAARLVHVVSSVKWPEDWDRGYLDAQMEDGSSILASDERDLARGGCNVVTHARLPAEPAALHLYAIAELASSDEVIQHAAEVTMQPMLEPVSIAVAGGHTQRYWLHRPEAHYRDPSAPMPVLVFLAGAGEDGDDAGANFDAMANRGLLGALTQRSAAVVDQPFLVIAPQCNVDRAGCWGWIAHGTFIDEVLAHVRTTYTFDDARVYVTGLSTGGEGATRYAIHSRTRVEGPEVAAAVPIASTYTDGTWYANNLCTLSPVPVWAFHNSDDPTQPVNNSRTVVADLGACATPPAVAPQLDEGTGGHNAWSSVYNGTHPFSNGGESSVYAWLLAHSR